MWTQIPDSKPMLYYIVMTTLYWEFKIFQIIVLDSLQTIITVSPMMETTQFYIWEKWQSVNSVNLSCHAQIIEI